MVYIIILVLAVSLDTLSFGLAQGFSKNKIPFSYAFCMTIFSTMLFAIPLYISSLIIEYLDEDLFRVINAVVLLLLGIYYLINSISINKHTHKNNNPLSFFRCMLSVFPISLDAIFTAFLSGYKLNFVIFGIFFYFIITFVAIFVGNRLTLKISKHSAINLDWLSGLLFVLLGIFKFIGF